MTDTEKAEKEFDEYCEKNLMVDIYEKSMFTDGYLAGLEAGRKDRNCVNCSNHSSNLRKENVELKKENAELKEYVSRAGYRIAEVKHEIDELKEKLKGFENGDVAWQGDMDATIKQNLELKAQIEKMKNCSNCNHYGKYGDEEYCWNCDRPYRGEVIKDEWELAE